MTATFNFITPLIPAGASLDEAIAFYTREMGFTCTWRSSFSIGVSGLDALYENYRALPVQVGPLEMKEWGRREFHMIVAPGVCFQFYRSP